jgi:hypothetical protein
MSNLPKEIILIIFEYLNDIDVKIYFNLIKKIDLNKFNNIDNIDNSLKIRKNNFYCCYDDVSLNIFYFYRYINILNNKFYRIIYTIDKNYENTIEIKTQVCDSLNRLYSYTVDCRLL